MTLWHGPAGKLVKGHVLDVNQKGFDSALKFMDPQLYTYWNPKKLRGWGCWEIRRRPQNKTALYVGSFKGMNFYRCLYLENNLVHHVMDCAFLNYDAIRKLKEMDTWGNPTWASGMEAREEAYRNQVRAKAKEDLKYAIKQSKSAARDLMEAVNSGVHPAQILTSISWQK